ncbi:PREDICTED: splicing regulator RBM11-like [Priapulus caudatus]|uniref:Splicing regulator RBM11-like n=1 Tax=Priapulus caudatus TaxID=37621 RepID=A0ABM1EJ70_PRICU|nr:PREDICTED: splicing regulator RBM11-like [Priapulus caudatus]
MNDENRTVWIGNISREVDEELLFELFLQAGPLESVKIAKDGSGLQRTFGFAVFKHEQSVPYTVDLLNNVTLCGRSLIVKARQLQQSPADSSYETLSRQNRLPQAVSLGQNYLLGQSIPGAGMPYRQMQPNCSQFQGMSRNFVMSPQAAIAYYYQMAYQQRPNVTPSGYWG